MTTPKSLLVTGASTGIGRACALHMAALGWRVFAGVRRESDAESLRQEFVARQLPVRLVRPADHLLDEQLLDERERRFPDQLIPDRLIPLFLDITELNSIAAAAEQIAAAVGEAGLDGLVNNAGIAIAGPLEFITLPDLRRQLEVNLMGQVAVIQACLPLLRRSSCSSSSSTAEHTGETGGGRIVNISSVGGLLAAPYFAPYSASKFALEALSDSLRVELRPWGIRVVVVEPGSIATPIWEKSLAEAEARLAAMPPAAEQLYGPSFPILRRLVKSSAQRGLPAEQVARVVAEALTARNPRARYIIPKSRGYTIALFRLLPVWLRDRILSLRFGIK